MTTQARVLVVDDDPVIAKSFDRVLSGKGYAVITARDGPEALEKLAREDYDAVFTDIRMPGMDGLEVAARIKATQPWLPVVIVTGYGSPASEARAKEIGVAGFLHKPLSPEMIEGSAREAMTWKAADRSSPAQPLPVEHAVAAPSAGRTAKNVGLFVAAPFIGLAYAVAFPFVGLALLAWYGYRALVSKTRR
jgi:CheY-like chemotaxis protein